MKKSLYFLCGSALLFGLSACDDSNSPASSSNGDKSSAESVETFDDLPKCKKSKYDDVYTVTEEETDYICYGTIKDWIEVVKKLPKCTDKKDGMMLYVEKDEEGYICKDEWISLEDYDEDEEDSPKSSASDDDGDNDDDDDVKSSSSKKSTIFDDDDDDDVKSSSSKKSSASNSGSGDSGDSGADNEGGENSGSGSDTGSTGGTNGESDNSGSGDKKPESSGDTPSDQKEKQVSLVDGIIWQPSYGNRAYTKDANVTEYNFAEDVKGGAGFWYLFNDEQSNGNSTITGNFEASYFAIDFSLVYKDWHVTKGGGYTYYAPDPYPYTAAAFDLAQDQAPVNIKELFKDGLCLTYTSSETTAFTIGSTATPDYPFYYNLPMATSQKTVNIEWSTFAQSIYAKDAGAVVSNATALAQAIAIRFEYTQNQANVSCDYGEYSASQCNAYFGSSSASLQIYKIGEYGKCVTSGL